MNLNIRPVRLEDAEDINAIRRMDGVRENIMGLISEKLSRSQGFINNLSEDEHLLVAEVGTENGKKVVGMIGLHVNKSPRAKHAGSLGIMIHRDYQCKGIGKQLMLKILDLADNWLMLLRIELGVFTDNEKALHLYKSLGFVIEGTKKYAIVKNGKYADEFIMARYNPNIIKP